MFGDGGQMGVDVVGGRFNLADGDGQANYVDCLNT